MLTGLDGPQLTSLARLGPEFNWPRPAHLFLLIYGPGPAHMRRAARRIIYHEFKYYLNPIHA